MSRNTHDGPLRWAAFFVGAAFVLGLIGLLIFGPAASYSSLPADTPQSWILAFVLLLIGPPVGTLFAYVWWGSNGR